MAALHVERKRSSTGLWILAGLVLLALAAWVAFGRDDLTEQTALEQAPPVGATTQAAGTVAGDGAVPGAPDPVNTYLRYSAANRAGTDADHTHRYTADGIRHLAAALGALAERDMAGDVQIQSQTDALRERADALQRNPGATNHAEQARAAFLAAASLMRSLAERGPSAAVAPVDDAQRAATAIEPRVLLLQQTAGIQRFFDDAGVALRAMAIPAST